MKEIKKKKSFQVSPRKGKWNGFYRDHAIQGFQVLPTYRVRIRFFFAWVYFFFFLYFYFEPNFYLAYFIFLGILRNIKNI